MPTQGDVVESALDPWALQKRINTAEARYSLASLVMPVPNQSYISYRGGVFASGDTGGVGGSGHMAMKVKAGGGWNTTVEMGNCIIDTPSNGPYLCALDSLKTLQHDPADGATNRIDLVIARVYDDKNSALGSPAGVRKFTVEIWKGDPSTGTASRPIPTPSAGWIPLAAVPIPKGTSGIDANSIVDLRGPGLVARGGMRALYGEDSKPGSPAFQEPGAYPGDQRWVHNAVFQHQVYYGAQDGWRGVHNCLVYSANPAPGGERWVKGYTTTEICRVSIPYPGTPYMIEPTARMYMNLSPWVGVDVRITLDSINGPTVNWVREDSMGDDHDRRKVPGVPSLKYGPLTTKRDVVLSVAIRDIYLPRLPIQDPDAWGFSYRGDDVGQSLLQVSVLPSTIPPPAV